MKIRETSEVLDDVIGQCCVRTDVQLFQFRTCGERTEMIVGNIRTAVMKMQSSKCRDCGGICDQLTFHAAASTETHLGQPADALQLPSDIARWCAVERGTQVRTAL